MKPQDLRGDGRNRQRTNLPRMPGRGRLLSVRRSVWLIAGLIALAGVWIEVGPLGGDALAPRAGEGETTASESEARRSQTAVGAYLDGLQGAPAELPAASEDRNIRRHLDAFYQLRSWEPTWFDQGWLRGVKAIPEARALLARANDAQAKGMVRPGSLEVDLLASRIDALERDPQPEELARLDVALTWTALHFLSQLSYGPVLPSEAGIQWGVALREVDLAGILDQSLEDELRGLEARTEPDHPLYRRLKEARSRYRAIVERGGWPKVPEGEVLEIGAEADPKRLRALRLRLAAEGFLEDDATEMSPAVYSPELAGAVGRFQATRTLMRDGRLGPSTREELNVPAERRLRAIELNLTRWRWIPDEIWDESVVVNIPGYHLWRYVDGEPRLDMEAVVGTSGWPTPVFSDELAYLVLDPAWNVPVSIVQEEIIPKLEENPDYLEENDMVLLEGWGSDARVVDSGRIFELASGNPGSLHLQQRPGPKNPLGTVKFMFPNRFNVYLHDTSARALFDEADRNLSHGCVRISRPYELAAELMEDEGWTPENVEQRVGRGQKREVPLPEKVTVYLLHWTVEVRPDGALHFYEDIYGIDRTQKVALAR